MPREVGWTKIEPEDLLLFVTDEPKNARQIQEEYIKKYSFKVTRDSVEKYLLILEREGKIKTIMFGKYRTWVKENGI